MTKKNEHELLTLNEVMVLQHLVVDKIVELNKMINLNFLAYHSSNSDFFDLFKTRENELLKYKELFDKLTDIKIEER